MVNITKFGAFVNILPGRDGLLHISKIGRGKRVERVEDVLELGQPVEVKVDDIDPQGKVSLSLAGEAPEENGSSSASERPSRGDGGGRSSSRDGRSSSRDDRADPDDRGGPNRVRTSAAPAGAASFEDSFEAELVQEFGDLGPATTGSPERSEGGGRGRGGRRRR